MIYRFKLVSEEVNNFSRVIDIDADASFLDLRNAILDSVDYSKDNIDSIYICSDDWEKEKEVTHEDLGLSSSDTDTWLMAETPLSDLLEEERQKLIFLFDNLAGRAFFMELKEILTGTHLDAPVCKSKVGHAPKQEMELPEVEEKIAKIEKADTSATFFDSDFEDGYGDDDLSDLDMLDGTEP